MSALAGNGYPAVDLYSNKGMAIHDLDGRVGAIASLVIDETSPPTATAGQGVVLGRSGTQGQVTQLSTPALAVQIVTAGIAINNLGEPVTIPATVDAPLPIAPGNPTNPRQDIVVATADGLVVREGTPAGSPVDPTLVDGDVVLARIAVAANATTVVTGNITDLRFFGGVTDIGAGSVTTAALAANAVTTAKIASEAVTSAQLGAASVPGTKLSPTGVVAATFNGVAAAGPVTLTGATVGQRVFALWQHDAAALPGAAAALFESTISVANQIQQTSSSDLHTHLYGVILLPVAA